MGTGIQNFALTLDDYWGKENCSEVLTLSRPDVIRPIHASYLEAGADVIETNSFGASSLVLAEFEMAERAREFNITAARMAKELAKEYSTVHKPRFVAGSIGPTTKLLPAGHRGSKQRVPERGGGSRTGYGDRELPEKLIAVQDSRGRGRGGAVAEADPRDDGLGA